jgi:alkanesulfonate monooxygenase SsuD/methylene tetrahydromethanopterin reductase-like flavin-dependent oxidoreductase (luciferase family)
MVRMGLVLYFGGMGSRKTNFYVDLAHRFGYGDIADEVQTKFQSGDKEGAFQACSDEVVNAVSLIGTEAEVAERLGRFRENGIDRLIATPVHPEQDQMRHTVSRLAELTR